MNSNSINTDNNHNNTTNNADDNNHNNNNNNANTDNDNNTNTYDKQQTQTECALPLLGSPLLPRPRRWPECVSSQLCNHYTMLRLSISLYI